MELVHLARLILALSARDLVRLNEILKAEGGEGLGVREPRRPKPESPGDAVAVEEDWPTPAPLPEDYWETAE